MEEPQSAGPSQCTDGLREAEEVFIYMHRNFRVSRNIRAHWFFDHINRAIAIEHDPPAEEGYGQEMSVVGILPKGGKPDEIVGDERFLVTHDTKVVYISRYYRHVYVLDLSPSTMVADEDCDGCLHSQLVDCLKLSLESSTKSFTKPGTSSVFHPQIYISVVVFVPFLTFEEDLVLAHSILVTEENVKEVMREVRSRFTSLLRSLYTFSRPIMHKWAQLRRIHKNRYESIRESDVDVLDCSFLNDENKRPNPMEVRMKDVALPIERRISIMNIPKRILDCSEIEDYEGEKPDEPGVEGYIIPEWALIFMLRLGLLSVQTLPENTQSNIIVITDGVAGMPDPQALQDLMNQMRSFTVSCSFIEIPQMVQKGAHPPNKLESLIVKTKSRHQPCFGHVTSCELFHFLAMATFGGYLPNFCSLKKPLDDEVGRFRQGFLSVNKFHRSLLCWSFQNALQDNKYISQLVMEMNPVFASLYKNKTAYHLEFNRSYVSTLNELLYVRLREGFTVKSVDIHTDPSRINIHLCLPFRPLVFLEYAIDAKWPSCRTKRETINVDLVVTGPENEIRDLQIKDNGDIHVYNPLRLKLIDTLKSSIHRIEEADSLLIHIHSFNTDAAFYSLPRGADEYPIHHLDDARRGLGMYSRINVVPIIRSRTSHDDFAKFLRFWGVLCNMNQDNWQKWVHVHFERVVLNCKPMPCNAFTQHGIKIQCTDSHKALHQLLKKRSSFCLIKDRIYVSFVKRRNDNIPCYFYMVHVSQEAPCIIMKTAFLGGISSTERRRVVELFRKSLVDLPTNPQNPALKAVTVIRRPLERILVRYQQLPETLKTIIRMKPEREKAKSGEAMEHAMHTVVNKYLVGRRHIWRLPLSVLIGGPDDNRNSRRVAEFVLSALLHRRIEEGFSVTWSRNGIVGLCRQVDIGSRSLLEQYILFHPANRNADDAVTLKGDAGLVLVSELWREPCADENDFPPLRPDTASDNELVSVLYTVNHLLLTCASQSGLLAYVDQTDEKVEIQLSRCVSMVSNVFNLYALLKNSRSLLLHLPTFNTGEYADDVQRMQALHASYLTEFANFCDASLEICDPTFFAKVLSRMFVDNGDPRVNLEAFEANGYDLRYVCGSRLLFRQVNPWVVLVILAPESTLFEEYLDYPVVVSICDEAILAYGLVKRRNVSSFSEYTLKKGQDWIENSFPAEELLDDNIVLNWVSDRGMNTLRTNYVQVRMKTVVQELHSNVIDRALSSAMYNLLRSWVPIAKEDVGIVLEDLCTYTTIEIEAVSTALETFCSHLKPDPPKDQDCCQEANLQKVFDDVVDKRFLSVPCNPNYYYFTPYAEDRVKPEPPPPPPKKEEKKEETKTPSPNISPLDIEATSSSETLQDDASISTDASPNATSETPLESTAESSEQPEEGEVKAPEPPKEPEKPSTVIRMNTLHERENVLTSTPRVTFRLPENGELSPEEDSNEPPGLPPGALGTKGILSDKRHTKSRKYDMDDSEPPLFVYFTCGVQFPSGAAEYFPVTFFPTCANQVLNLCQNASIDEDVSQIRVRLVLYVLTWPTTNPFADDLDDSEDEEVSARSSVFLANLPERERGVVNELLMTMNRVLELESLLIDSRREDITHEKLQKISSFIAREVGDSFSDNGKNMCKKSGMASRVTQRRRELSLVIPSPEAVEDLMSRLENMVVDYCLLRRSGKSNVYYICRVEDKAAFEHQVKTHLSGDPSAKLPSVSEEQFQDLSDADTCSRSVSFVDNAYISDSLLHDFDFSRKDLLCDFWVILTLDDVITLQFCQRYATEPSHYKIYDLTWKLARQTIRIINQELLLDSMFQKRECHSLLMTKEVASADGVVNETVSDDDISGGAHYTFAPGSFACPVQWMKWIEVHARLRWKHAQGPLFEAATILRRGLEQHMVMNIPNTYVFKEENGNVLYFQIYTSFETFTNSLRSYSVELNKAEIAETKARMESNTCILVAGFGVQKPSRAFATGLTTLFEKKINQHVLEKLIDIWKRNPRSLLDPADIEFIQPDETRPVAVMHFSIPSGLSRFMSGVSYYYHQYLQMFMHAARIRETQSGESRPFRPYPLLSPQAMDRQYAPVFYLHIKSGQGSRLKGIACVEMRIVNANGEMEPLSDGVLRLESHKALVKNSRDAVVVKEAFVELTRSEAEMVTGRDAAASVGRKITPAPVDGICGYIQIIVWQAAAGDVGIPELEDYLKTFAEQSFCDVVTEYGILNVNVLESGTIGPSLLPPQSPISTTPQKISPKSSPGPADAARRSFRKRDSTDTLHKLPSNGSSDQNSVKRGSSNRRGSIASDLGRDDIVLPSSMSRERAPDRVSASFYPSIEQWMSFVVKNKKNFGSSFESIDYTLDSFSIVRKVLFLLRDRLEKMSSKADNMMNPLLVDRVVVCERVHRNKEEFYEVLSPEKDNIYMDESSAAADDAPQYMLIAYCHEVSKESQRYGYDKTASASEAPAVLKHLLNQMDKKDNMWNFLPCLNPFIPRRRIMYCSVRGNTLSLYMYNYMPEKVNLIDQFFTRTICWWNAKARLIKEINRTSETNVLLPEFRNESDNTYLPLVFQDPLSLIKHDYPPEKRPSHTVRMDPDLARRLFRSHKRFAPVFQSSCPITRQLEQFRVMREEVEKQIQEYQRVQEIHERLLKGVPDIQENDLYLLQGCARRVHYVQTPVLLFPAWRKKVGEVRYTGKPEPRHVVSPPRVPAFSGSLGTARTRASTMHHQNNAVIRQPTAREDDDPCHIIMLYKLMTQYVEYLKMLGLQLFNVTNLGETSRARNYYSTEYKRNSGGKGSGSHPPSVCLYKAVQGGIVIVRLFFVQPYFIIAVGMFTVPELLLRDPPSGNRWANLKLTELEEAKDFICSRCHIHSFTYDFHLRMMERYLVHQEVLFSHGYNTNTFLLDFLNYYGCRPPNARNCVYEERNSFELPENISAPNVWECFLNKNYEEKFNWRVVRIRLGDDENDTATAKHESVPRENEYMLVSSETKEDEDYSKICILIKDKRKKEAPGMLPLTLYLILIDKDQTRPMDEIRHREDSRQSDVGEFRNVLQPTEEQLESEIEAMVNMVNSGKLPSVDGISRRRFSSGGHTTPVNVNTTDTPEGSGEPSPMAASDRIRGSDSDLSIAVQGSGTLRHRSQPVTVEDNGEIPGEKVVYVQFLSTAQRDVQQLLECTMKVYCQRVSLAVTEANRQCRIEFLWNAVNALPTNHPATLPRLGQLAKGGASELIWDLLRSQILHEATIEDLNGLIPLVTFENMDQRDERMKSLLQGTSCARLCRFLVYKFGPGRCRLFESQQKDQLRNYGPPLDRVFPFKKALVVTDPANPVLFLVTCRGEDTPNILMLFRKAIDYEGSQQQQYFGTLMDKAFDELVQCVTAFLWADLVYKPPSKNLQ